MHILRVLRAFVRVNLQQDLAYRSDIAMQIILSLFWTLWELAGLGVIFANTPSIAGWNIWELIALSGMWRLVNGFMISVVWPNTELFNRGVREGTLDYMFLLPLNSQLHVSVRRMTIWRVWDTLMALAFIIIGLSNSTQITTLANVASFVVLTLVGVVIIYSLWIVLIALTFWFTKFDNNVTLLSALTNTGRFPATVYPVWLRLIVTFLVPIAVATTVPLQALRGELPLWQVAGFVLLGVAAVFVSSRVWKVGSRKYSGASA